MPDLNTLLLFVAIVSPLVVLARTARRAALNRNWQFASLAVLLATGIAWTVAPQYAGCVGGAVWCALLFLPAVGLRRATELGAEERYATARRMAAPLRWLHPAKALRDELLFLRAMEAAQNGAPDRAVQVLEQLHASDSRVGLLAIAQSFRIRGDWAGLLAWSRQNVPLVALGRQPALLPLYFRALGETGAIDDLVLQMAGRAPALLGSSQYQGIFNSSLLIVLAFAGRTNSLTHLLRTRLRGMHTDTKEFWTGTSQLAAGDLAEGRARLETLRGKTKDGLVRADIDLRLREPGRPQSILSSASESTVLRFEKNLATQRRHLLAPRSGRPTRGIAVIIALNAIMFALEIAYGGTTNAFTLHRLGALEPFSVFVLGQYWRLLTALFLHYGPVHLIVNLYALYVLGPPLEASIGSLRFGLCYLAGGLGSSAGVVALWRLGWTRAALLVGASGAVMGIVGAWAGLLLRHHHLPMARRRLLNLGMIVLIQTAFDYFTPQVSMSAHLCGLASGLLIGLLVGLRKESS